MSKTLYTPKGKSILLGRELGKGGEGSVYEVPASPDQVAKLYHHAPDAKKQAKLRFMAATADAQLLSYVAWPQETLHAQSGGPVMGFLMPKVTGRDPIHMVYSPAHRQQERPTAAWDFLLFVARNTAVAFEALHSHGHVLGDVNQGNVLVGSDSKVVLIDSDSFQVNKHGTLHLCEVGVSHFTPPELQGLSSFHGVTRSANHDNFGLALLLFHLLFGGRHPYSGVPLIASAGEALETDIRQFRYAYGPDAKSRGMAPPPRSISPTLLPPTVEEMFYRAFTEKGAAGQRPTAQQWGAALDTVRGSLIKCGDVAMHVYPNHLKACPWCTLEKQGVMYFLDLGTVVVPTTTGDFVLARVWALIEQVPPLPAMAIPDPNTFAVTPAPLPAFLLGKGQEAFLKGLTIVGTLGGMMTFSGGWFFFLVAGMYLWAFTDKKASAPRRSEQVRRRTAADTAQREFTRWVGLANHDLKATQYEERREELRALRKEYEGLPHTEQKTIDQLSVTAHSRQLERYLRGCFIDSATISGVGPARKSALRSFGIETAADVEWDRVSQVRGFGESLTRAVVDWRARCERKFTYNPNKAVTPEDRRAVQAKFAKRKAELEKLLSQGPGELQRLRRLAMTQQTHLQSQLMLSAKKLAQAKMDLSLMC